MQADEIIERLAAMTPWVPPSITGLEGEPCFFCKAEHFNPRFDWETNRDRKPHKVDCLWLEAVLLVEADRRLLRAIQDRRQDPEFMARLERIMTEHKGVLDALKDAGD